MTADQRGHGVGVAIEEYTKTSVKDKAAAAKKLEQEVLGKTEDCEDAFAKGILMECNGVQFFRVSLTY